MKSIPSIFGLSFAPQERGGAGGSPNQGGARGGEGTPNPDGGNTSDSDDDPDVADSDGDGIADPPEHASESWGQNPDTGQREQHIDFSYDPPSEHGSDGGGGVDDHGDHGDHGSSDGGFGGRDFGDRPDIDRDGGGSSSFADPQSSAMALGAQALQSGHVRSGYAAAVGALDAGDELSRTMLKSLARTFEAPVSRVGTSLIRPGLGMGGGTGALTLVPDEQGLRWGTWGGAPSANVTNRTANALGRASTAMGGALVIFAIGNAAYQTAISDNRTQTGVTQLGALGGSVAGGYVGAYAAEAVAVGLLGTNAASAAIAAVAGAAAAPAIAAGIGVLVVVGATVYFAHVGASTSERLAADLYHRISQ